MLRDDYLKEPIPPRLRTYHGTGAYDGAELPGGRDSLIWSEPVGARLVLVWRPAHDGAPTYVAILGPGGHTFERFKRIRAYTVIPDDMVDMTGVRPELREDDYVRVNRFAIGLATRWVGELREQPAPLATPDADAWLRRQLAGLGGGEPQP